MKRAAVLAAMATGLAVPATAHSAELSATPSNLGSVFAAAQPGDTIRLASGDYGTFSGGAKSGTVALTPASGATPSMKVKFTAANGIRIDGVRITDAEISGSSKNIAIVNGDFTNGQAIIRTSDLVNANILLDHNRFVGFNVCSGCYEGRINLPGSNGSGPSGVTISNNLFSGGESDGIQNGGNGVQILNNEFAHMKDDPSLGPHVDALQLYGSSNTVIRGNYFHDVPNGVVAFDQADHEVIENNVFDNSPSGSRVTVTLVSDNGSIVRHNTMVAGGCSDGGCGVMRLGYKPEFPGGKGTIVRDNIVGMLENADSSNSFTADHNLVATTGAGPGDFKGKPAYTGGAATPFGSPAGYTLAAGSPGKGKASDGTDIGAQISAVGIDGGNPNFPGAPQPAPAPTTPAAGAPVTNRATPKVGVARLWRISPNRPMVHKRVILRATPARVRGRHCVWKIAGGKTRRGCTVIVRFLKAGRKRVTLTITEPDGSVFKRTRTFTVRR